jgi:chromosome segregation ATPase|tara:strand:- start:1350 stop:1763 length:414 start_codon:yes stop_codon:yes gene_type:complete
MLKYFASIPIVLTLLASLYGGFTYINKLTNQIDDSTKEIMMLRKDIENIHQIYSDKTNRNSQNYTMAREELVKELAEYSSWLGRVEGVVNALRDSSYSMASDAEVRALEEAVRTNTTSVRDIGYEMKELERKLSGGY